MKIQLALVSLLLPLSASVLSAQTIYSDSFSRTGEIPGSHPDVPGASATYTGGDNYTANGSVASATIGGGVEDEDLPFTSSMLPSSPTGILTISADVTSTLEAGATDAASNWTAVGFSNANPIYNGSGPWMLLRVDGDVVTFNSGSPNGGTTGGTATMSSGTLAVQLNFTTDVVTYSLDGTPVNTATFSPSAFLSSVTNAEFAGFYTNSTVDNFKVTYTATPEPSSGLLLGLGVVALFWAARRLTLGIAS